jgi:hypothetical protein
MEDRYETGKGLFGGPGGTYGRYSVGSRVTEQGKSLRNLSTQFNSVQDIEEQQRRRFGRRRESGYSGAGSWFLNYPYMLGTLGSGTGSYDTRDQNQPVSDGNDTASATDGTGNGGTAAGFIGGLGT